MTSGPAHACALGPVHRKNLSEFRVGNRSGVADRSAGLARYSTKALSRIGSHPGWLGPSLLASACI